MALTINGTTPKKIKYNNLSVAKVIYDNKVVWRGLPSTYQQVEYIQTSGTQFINTGVFPTTNIQVETKIEVASTSQDKSVFGSYIASGSSSLGGYYHLTPYKNKWYWGGNNAEGNGGTYSPVIGTQYNITFNNDSGKIIVNDGELNPTMNLIGYNNSSLAIARRGTNANSRFGIFKYFYFKVYDKTNQIYLRDFVPCYRKTDNISGMYDLIGETFYTNDGTGNFVVGADV